MLVDAEHFDKDAAMNWSLTLEVSIDPGQAALSRLDPGRCEPWRSRGIEDLHVRRVRQLVLYHRGDGETCVDRVPPLGESMPPSFADALAREFQSRLGADDELRASIEDQVLRRTRSEPPDD